MLKLRPWSIVMRNQRGFCLTRALLDTEKQNTVKPKGQSSDVEIFYRQKVVALKKVKSKVSEDYQQDALKAKFKQELKSWAQLSFRRRQKF